MTDYMHKYRSMNDLVDKQITLPVILAQTGMVTILCVYEQSFPVWPQRLNKRCYNKTCINKDIQPVGQPDGRNQTDFKNFSDAEELHC